MTKNEKAAAILLKCKHVKFDFSENCIYSSDKPIPAGYERYGYSYGNDTLTEEGITTTFMDGYIPDVNSRLDFCCGVAEIGELHDLGKEVKGHPGLSKLFLADWFANKNFGPGVGAVIATVTGKQSKTIIPLLEEFGFEKKLKCKSNHGAYPIYLFTKVITPVRKRTVAVKSSRSTSKER